MSRLLVVLSALLAVIAGLAPLLARPAVFAALAVVFVAAMAAGRARPIATGFVVLGTSYVSYGLVRMIGGPELAAMPFFLAAFAGFTLGTCSWRRWHAPRRWRLPLAWWATWVAVSWPFAAARELGGAWAPTPAIGSIVTEALLQMSLALWIDRLLESAHPTPRLVALHPLRWRWAFIISAAVTAAAALYQRWVDLSWMSGEPWIHMGRSVGLMGDGNPMGIATALWAPVAVVAAGGTPRRLVTALGLAVVLWVAAWTSGGRTMLILAPAGMVALLLVAARTRGWSRRVLAGAVAMAAVAGTVALAATASRVSSSSPLGRLLWATPQSSVGAAVYEMAWRREGYGLAAAQVIREHPLVGIGVGRFRGLSTGYVQRITGRSIPPDNAQNLWRQTWAEQGLVGLAPLLWLTGLTIASLLSPSPHSLQLVVRIMVAALGASLLVGYPVQDAAVAVTLATLVAQVAGSGSGLVTPMPRSTARTRTPAAALV